MDSISALNVFVQVAETRSFVGAGRLLGVSASAVGKRINLLEQELGARLFHRSTRSVTLTPEGLLFLQRCRRILGEVAAAQEELRHLNQAPRGRLRVSLPLVVEPFLPVLAEFKRRYPEADLELDFTDRRVDVIEEGFDAVVRSIRFRFPNTGKLQLWPLGAAEIELPQSIVCNNLEARVGFALQGLGIAYLPGFGVDAYLAAGSLVQVLPDYTENGGTFRIMWPSGKSLPPKLRVLIDFLSERLFAA